MSIIFNSMGRNSFDTGYNPAEAQRLFQQIVEENRAKQVPVQSASFSTSQQAVIPEMREIYNDLLARNQRNYENVQNAYTSASAGLATTLPGIYDRYGQLSSDVLGMLGVGGNRNAVPGGVGSRPLGTPGTQGVPKSYAAPGGTVTQTTGSSSLGAAGGVSALQPAREIPVKSQAEWDAELASRLGPFRSATNIMIPWDAEYQGVYGYAMRPDYSLAIPGPAGVVPKHIGLQRQIDAIIKQGPDGSRAVPYMKQLMDELEKVSPLSELNSKLSSELRRSPQPGPGVSPLPSAVSQPGSGVSPAAAISTAPAGFDQSAGLGSDRDWGVAAPAARAIERLYSRRLGETDQALVNAGLGNTTVRPSFQGQNARMAAEEYENLGAALADKAAGYQAQIGLAEMQARLQGAGLQTDQANRYISDLANFRFGNTAGDLTGTYGTSQSIGFGAAPFRYAQPDRGPSIQRPSSSGPSILRPFPYSPTWGDIYGDEEGLDDSGENFFRGGTSRGASLNNAYGTTLGNLIASGALDSLQGLRPTF